MVKLCTFIGTALEGLSAMQSFLKGRPKSFSSIEKAIEWRYSRNIDKFVCFSTVAVKDFRPTGSCYAYCKIFFLVFAVVSFVILNLQEFQCPDNLLSKSRLDILTVRDYLCRAFMSAPYFTCMH